MIIQIIQIKYYNNNIIIIILRLIIIIEITIIITIELITTIIRLKADSDKTILDQIVTANIRMII